MKNTPVNLYVADLPSTSTMHWQHILQVNKIFGTNAPDSIADYNQRQNATNVAPEGFDGKARVWPI